MNIDWSISSNRDTHSALTSHVCYGNSVMEHGDGNCHKVWTFHYIYDEIAQEIVLIPWNIVDG